MSIPRTKSGLRKCVRLKHIIDVASYLKTLLTDKHENNEKLISTLQKIYGKGVDTRQFAYLKLGCVKLDKES
jgi:hypothetical protein